MRWLSHMIVTCLILQETAEILSKVAVPFHMSSSKVLVIQVFYILIRTSYYNFLFNLCDSYVVAFHCGFNLYLMANIIFHLYILFMSFHPLSNWSFESFSHILDVRPLSDIWLANIFSSLHLVFSFSSHSLYRVKVFHLDEVQIINFTFMYCVFDVTGQFLMLCIISL